MGKILIILIVCCLGSQIRAQHTKIDSIKNIYGIRLDSLLNQYKCNSCSSCVIRHTKRPDTCYAMTNQPIILDSNLAQIFKAIIPNASSNIINNMPAFGYVNDEDGGKLNLNAAFEMNKDKSKIHKTFLNIGAVSDSKKGSGIYSGQSWSSNVGLTVGVSTILGRSNNQYFDPVKCATLKTLRDTIFSNDTIGAINILLNTDISLINQRINYLDSLIKRQKETISTDTTNHFKELASLKAMVEEYKKYATLNRTIIDSLLTAKLIAFDKQHNILYGYNLFWMGANFGIFNNKINIADKDSLLDKKNIAAIDSRLKLSFEVNFNFSHAGKRTYQYAQFDALLLRSTLLENPIIKDPGLKANGSDSTKVNIINKNSEAYNMGSIDYDLLNKAYWQMKWSLYYANFFGFERSLGLSAQLSYNHQVSSKKEISFKPLYTFLVGPVFRVQTEDDWNKATFGISCGFDNVPFKVNAWKYFSAKMFVAVPFNVFSGKK